MPERLRGSAHQEQARALQLSVSQLLQERHGIRLTEWERERLEIKASAFIGKMGLGRVDASAIASGISDRVGRNSHERQRWFTKAGIKRTLEEAEFERRQSALRRRVSLMKEVEWTPLRVEASTKDGRYYLAELETGPQIRGEGQLLKHCLAEKSLDYYMRRIAAGEVELFSIRDNSTHEPVVTIEYDVKRAEVTQVKTIDNGEIVFFDSYSRATLELLGVLKHRSTFLDKRDPYTLRPLKRPIGRIFGLRGFILSMLTGEPESGLVVLPSGVISQQDLEKVDSSEVLSGFINLRTLPDAIISKLPHLMVDIDARTAKQSDIEQLKNLSVPGTVYLRGNSKIVSLPNGLTIAGDLKASSCARLKHLPSDLIVGGNMDLSYSTEVRSLPSQMALKGTLRLDGATFITTIPDAMQHISGDLQLYECAELRYFPKALSIAGKFTLARCQNVECIGERLSVGRSLFIADCPALKQLPEDMSVGGAVNIERCGELRNLPSRFRVIHGDLNLSGCGSLESLPESMVVKGNMNLMGCRSLRSLPKSLVVEGKVELDEHSGVQPPLEDVLIKGKVIRYV